LCINKFMYCIQSRRKRSDYKLQSVYSFYCINPNYLTAINHYILRKLIFTTTQLLSTNISQPPSTKIPQLPSSKMSNINVASPAFLLLSSEIRISVYEHLLSDFTGDTTDLQGAMMSSSQVKAELEHEMPRMLHVHLTATVLFIQQAWAAQFPTFSPLLITLSPADAELTLSVSIPKSVFLTSHRDLNTDPLVSVLSPLLPFYLTHLTFTIHDDDVSASAGANNPVAWFEILVGATARTVTLPGLR
jgi:hypothetical protein